MEEGKKMFKIIYGLSIAIIIFAFLIFSPSALANYGSGLYGSGLFSVTPVSTPTVVSSNAPINNPPAVPAGGFQMISDGSNYSFNVSADVTKMAVSLDGDFTKISLEDYHPFSQAELCSKLGGVICQSGTHTIYIKFYTAAGIASDVLSQTIIIGAAPEAPLITPTINIALSKRLSGRILLQVEAKGEGWYINPTDSSRYYLGRPADAFAIMRQLALGVSNRTWATFKNNTAPARLAGRILLKVEDNGRAYYVNPLNLKMYYLGRPDDAFAVMRSLGLGISDNNLSQIKVGTVK